MRVTELSNPLTLTLDVAKRPERAAMIEAAEREIFGSQAWGPGLGGEDFLEKLARLRGVIRRVLRQSNGRVILAGAGTSGRLAIHAATSAQAEYGRGRVLGLLAGGMSAFFQAREGVEDSAAAGISDLVAALKGAESFVYVGISCGLSAVYVAAQVEYALNREAAGAAVSVLGFNPRQAANRRIIDDRGGSFAGILDRLVEAPNGILLNPVIGPEPVTGSTRMKGGTATKILLDILLNSGPEAPRDLLADYRGFQAEVFRHQGDWMLGIEAAEVSLSAAGGFAYLGAGRAGMMALLDASECPPTFGSRPGQVGAFVEDGFGEVLPGFDLQGHRYADFLAEDRASSPVFLLDWGGPAAKTKQFQKRLRAQAGALFVYRPQPGIMRWVKSRPALEAPHYLDLALKWVLNLISTCAFAGAGKVYGNLMIDLRISNLKLWERAIRIVAEIAGVPEAVAEANLRHFILEGVDDLGEGNPLQLIGRAVRTEKTVPAAILMARWKIGPKEALRRLAREPRIKSCLDGGA